MCSWQPKQYLTKSKVVLSLFYFRSQALAQKQQIIHPLIQSDTFHSTQVKSFCPGMVTQCDRGSSQPRCQNYRDVMVLILCKVNVGFVQNATTSFLGGYWSTQLLCRRKGLKLFCIAITITIIVVSYCGFFISL